MTSNVRYGEQMRNDVTKVHNSERGSDTSDCHVANVSSSVIGRCIAVSGWARKPSSAVAATKISAELSIAARSM